MQLLDVALVVAGEAGCGDGPLALAAFLVRALDAKLERPQRPGRFRRALVGRQRHDLELLNGSGLLAVARAQAIRARIASADDDDALAARQRGGFAVEAVPRAEAVLQGQKVHGEVDAVQLAAGHRQVARLLGAAGQQDGVELLAQVLGRNVVADVGLGLERDSFGHELLDAAVQNALFELEIGDAVTQQAADAVGLFEDRDGVAGAVELLRRGQARRTRTDHRHSLSAARRGRLGTDPALLEGVLDDRLFDLLDGDRRLVDSEHAGGLAGRRADAAGDLREVVGGVQNADGLLPAVAVDQVVPVGDDVVERTAGVAEGHAAIHAARALGFELLFGKLLVDFEEVVDALGHRTPRGNFAFEFQKTGRLTHGAPPGPPVLPRWGAEAPPGARPPAPRPARACTRGERP